jgi:hypothetical protein
MFNDFKTKYTPKVHYNQLNPEASNAIPAGQSVYIRVRSLIEVFYYNGSAWSSVQTIDGTSGAVGVHLELDPTTSHIGFVSASSKKVVAYLLSDGLSSDSFSSKVSGEAIASSERLALQGRVANIEGLQLVHRGVGFVPPYHPPVDPEVFFDFGEALAGLADKSLILFVNGKAFHETDYVIHANNDGRIKFSNGLPSSDFGTSINIAVWE